MSHDKVRFVTVAGNIDMDMDPERGFEMSREMTGIRGAGYMMSESCYIPIGSILAVFTYDSKIAQQAGTFNLGTDRGKLN